LLPEYMSTPDGMAIDAEGNLIFACPDYTDPSMPGCILKIDENKRIRKWVEVPVSEETGHAFPMGIAFGPDGDLNICDRRWWPPGWSTPTACGSTETTCTSRTACSPRSRILPACW
jgi:hypothetical protein